MKTPNTIKMSLRSVSKFLTVAATAGLLALSGQQAFAERGDLSVSLKYSKPQPDDITIAGTNLELKGDSGFGFAIGYEYDPNWTVEFEYLTSKSNDPNGAGAQISGKFTGFHLSGVYRTDRQISAPYFIGKIGFGKTDFKFTQAGFTGVSDDDTGLVYGVGGGYMFSDNLSFEAMYFAEASDYKHILVGIQYKLGRGI